jgi:1-acyl-sn-glycerol-3-phosphate acyltransferase
VFPEGTTSDGHTVQPFHSALFQSAMDATAPVMPLALCYFDAHSHQLSHAADYVGDMTLVSCLWSIAASAGLIAQLEPLPSTHA